jgi:ParB family chromosome partitioning protein
MKNTNPAPVSIPVEKLHPFEGHPYQVKDDEEMNALIRSIQEHGVLSPLIVRPLENTTDEYEVLSGHRRLRAAVKAGRKEIPAFIVALDRDAAAIAVVDSNLHREHILPSEKAFAYRLKMEALRHQGTSCQPGAKSRSDAQIAETADESARQIQRYIRLTHLIPELLQQVDEGRIALNPAVEISYLNGNSQHVLLEAMRQNDCTPSLAQAIQLKKLSQEGALSGGAISQLLSELKPNQQEKLKIPMERIRGFFPKTYSETQMEEAIVKMCEAQYRRKMRDCGAR